MPTAVTGNSKILIGMDQKGTWTELFYPYVGKYQNIRTLYAGLYNNKLTWFKDAENRQYYLNGTNAIVNEHRIDGFIAVNSIYVHPNHDVIVSKYTIKNTTNEHKQVKLYIYENLKLAERSFRDSVVYDDELKAIVHFKEDLYFIFKGIPDFSSYTCGETEIKGLTGAYVDACDGKLEQHPVCNGSVDACMEFQLSLPPYLADTVRLLIVAAENYVQGKYLLKHVYHRIPEIEEETEQFWKSWIKKAMVPPIGSDKWAILNDTLSELYKRSLMVIELHADANGGIIASPDSSSLNTWGDTYNYVWWRDGAFIAMAMDAAKYHGISRNFFEYAKRNQTSGGFFLHRHLPDGALGSTWHKPPFIQIDQTGIIIKALEYHYKRTLDINFLRSLWSMVKKAANFLVKFRTENALPKPSYDLWEERFGIFTYSAAAVYAGLHSAALIAHELGKSNRGELYQKAAAEVKEAILEYLYTAEKGYFLRSVDPYDATVDASILGVVLFDVIDARDERASNTIKIIEQRLLRNGGIARYEGDTYRGYMNPWIICTLWLAEALLKKGEIDRAISYLSWTASCQLYSSNIETRLLPEQIANGEEPKSVMPLVWSHACFVWVMHQLLNVFEREQQKKRSYEKERLYASRSSIA
jgi:oligosaccharide amylase